MTTNFKSDKVSIPEYPYSIIYKLYKPLPDIYEKLDEKHDFEWKQQGKSQKTGNFRKSHTRYNLILGNF